MAFRHSFIGGKNNVGLAVYSCGIQKCRPCHEWGPAMRDHYLIHYIVGGKGKFSTKQKNWDLKENDAFIITPNTIAHYKADEKEPWEYCWVGFYGSDAKHLLNQSGLLQYEPVFHCKYNNNYKNLMMKIVSSSGASNSSEARMEGRLLLFLSELIDDFGTETTKSDLGFEYVKKAIKYIDHNYAMPINVQQIADSADISPSHLYRLFIKYINLSPNEYLTNYRIKQAASFIRTEGLSVNEAAYSVGFSDPLYFSRVFKKKMGIPPSQYVSSLKKGEINK